jgi:N6-adenosine-specific RNA methylase IME4
MVCLYIGAEDKERFFNNAALPLLGADDETLPFDAILLPEVWPGFTLTKKTAPELVAFIEDYRAKHGLDCLALDPMLSLIGADYADMMKNPVVSRAFFNDCVAPILASQTFALVSGNHDSKGGAAVTGSADQQNAARCVLQLTTQKPAPDGTTVIDVERHKDNLGFRFAKLVLKRDPETLRERQGARTDLSANLRGGSPRKAADDAATVVNVSPRSVEHATKVLRDGAPELIAAVEDGRVSVSTAVDIADAPEAQQRDIVARGEKEVLAAAKQIRERKQRERTARKVAVIRRIESDALAFPDGPFHVLVVDPPWKYELRAEDATHRGRCPYPDMSTEGICALPVARLAQPTAVLWLWTTNAFMRDAFVCVEAWGFTQKTMLTWVKDKVGVGNWLRGQTEHCLLATRGRPVVSLTNQTTALQAPVREHSRKPDEFYALVESLCPGSRVELFARQERAGWSAWGAETGQFDAA